MKTVDFHCHTKATKKHESELRTVTPELFDRLFCCAYLYDIEHSLVTVRILVI